MIDPPELQPNLEHGDRAGEGDLIMPDAWKQALDILGEHDASIVIAVILQRGEEIKSAGGYLRVLTGKAREGEFSLGPVLMALLRGKASKAARERRQAGRSDFWPSVSSPWI